MFKVLLIVAAIAVCVSPVIAQDEEFALLVQTSPAYAGLVTPSTVVQMSGLDKLVDITATPRDGYEFVYWLGDVADPTNNITTVLVDTPKMVIAIFERSELAIPPSSGSPASAVGATTAAAGPASRLTRSRQVSYSHAMSAVTPDTPRYNYPSYPTPTFTVDLPVVPIPEPATMILLGSGVVMLVRRKRS